MVIYLTTEPKNSIRSYFLNFRSYAVIDAPTIKEEEESMIRGDAKIVELMIQRRICLELKKAKHKRRNMNLIYISKDIDNDLIESIREYYDDDNDDIRIILVKKKDQEVNDEVDFDDIIEL